ncbi:MAG TPA: hypothetical protein VF899_13810 [Pyrinomonadaceae bacterium]
MKDEAAPNCGRENDLITFLYGELNDVEARTFQRHVRVCASCNAELEAFRDIRESVVAWRNEALGVISSPAWAVMKVDHKKSSALAALREFFRLSPLWMKAAVAVASVLFCILAGFAIARFRDKPPVATIANQGSTPNSPQELEAIVERRVREELIRRENSKQRAPDPKSIRATADEAPRQRVANRGNTVAFNLSNQKARRPLSKTEREQLAADLRLISVKSESDLDLLDDRINQ